MTKGKIGIIQKQFEIKGISVYLLIFLSVISILFSCKKDKSEEQQNNQPKVGEVMINGTSVTSPSSTLYVNGDAYNSIAQIPKGKLGVVYLYDSVYFIYNDGRDTLLQLNRENSIIAIFKLLVNYYEEKNQLKSTYDLNTPTDQLKTGIDMNYIGGNTYKFINQKARWVGIQVDTQTPFLLESRDLIPEISIGAAIGLAVDALTTKDPELEVTSCVKSYGSPLRAFLSPLSTFAVLLNSNLVNSFKLGIQQDPEFMKKVVFADAISLSANGAIQVIASVVHITDLVGVPLGACNDFVANALVDPFEIAAWSLLNSTTTSEYDASKSQVLKSAGRLMGSQVTCIGQAACAGATGGVCLVIGEIIKFFNDVYNDFAFIANSVAGAYDASTTFAYDIKYLNGDKPQLLTPANGYVTSSLTPTLTCQPYSGATSYNFQVAIESNFSNPIIDANSSSCQYNIANGILAMGTQYFWRVRIINSNSIFSPWSDVWSFTTYSNNMLGTPVLLNPSDNSTDILPTAMFDWNDVANATNYELQIDPDENFSSPIVDQQYIYNSQYNNASGVLQLNTKYYWRVKAKSTSASSLWSETWNFTTTSTLPSNVILPLAVGNYWNYLLDITSQTINISITGTITIQGETCYKWYAQGDQYEWYYKNKSDGCWAYGYNGTYQYPPDLEYKYPANQNDTWVTNWIAVPVPTTMTCESINTTFESYSGCYKYHFFLPMKKDNYFTNIFKGEVLNKFPALKNTANAGYDVYQYFVPGIGMVGWENYFQGTRLYKVVLTDYHLNK